MANPQSEEKRLTPGPGARQLAELFHDRYERLAPRFGYVTREETRAFDPTSTNGRLMIAVCDEILTWFDRQDSQIEQLREELEIERLRLAACGTAALGYFTGCDPKYDSASLQDVLRMQTKAAAWERLCELFADTQGLEVASAIRLVKVQLKMRPEDEEDPP